MKPKFVPQLHLFNTFPEGLLLSGTARGVRDKDMKSHAPWLPMCLESNGGGNSNSNFIEIEKNYLKICMDDKRPKKKPMQS